MKQEKVYKIFRDSKLVHLINRWYVDDEERQLACQYIGDLTGYYPLENLPEFDSDTIKGLLGLPTEKDIDCYVYDLPKWMRVALTDMDDSDVPLKEECHEMFGHTVLTTYTQAGEENFPKLVYFIETKYLEPLKNERYTLISRNIPDRGRMVIAKTGMLTKAIIEPHLFAQDILKMNIELIEDVFSELNTMKSTVESVEDMQQTL